MPSTIVRVTHLTLWRAHATAVQLSGYAHAFAILLSGHHYLSVADMAVVPPTTRYVTQEQQQQP